MPPKRRRVSTDARSEDEPSNWGTPAAKRRRHFNPLEVCQDIFDTLRNHKNTQNRLLCEAFIRVPKRRTDPEYYMVVNQPIDMLKIQHKLRSEEYDEIDQLAADITLLVNNAKAYYQENSQEFQDACDMMDLFYETKSAVLTEIFGTTEIKEAPSTSAAAKESTSAQKEAALNEDDKSSVCTTDDEDLIYEQMFSAVYLAKEGTRDLAIMFRLLPSKSAYPDYYKVIKKPIDLKQIALKIQRREYTALEELVKDLMLLIANAKSYNEPGSKIYKDAHLLKKVIQTTQTSLEQQANNPGKSSARIRSRRSANTQRLSAVCAALEYDTDSDDMVSGAGSERGDGGDTEQDTSGVDEERAQDGPLWALFNCIKNYKNAKGETLADPFKRLPSKRDYADYYDEIDQPMALLRIQKNLKNSKYSTMDAMCNDLDLVFMNAQQYNIEDSKLHQDAITLAKLMQLKRKELELTGHIGKNIPVEDNTNLGDPILEVVSPPISLENYLKETDTSMEVSISKTPQPRGRGRPPDSTSPSSDKRRSLSNEDSLKKRLKSIYKLVFEHKVDGRQLIDIFLQLPLKKDYPDYYQVITEPIDMTMIEYKIDSGKYHNEHLLISDLELMFHNARHYNEEHSQVYKDAEVLEKLVKAKARTILTGADSPKARTGKPGRPRGRKSNLTPLKDKLLDLYNTILNYTDSRGRTLSTPFVKLPSKNEYPDYYEVIKNPVDLNRIFKRMQGHGTISSYTGVEDMVADFVQMFDNACRFNESDSLIYKDALTLQRVCLERKHELCAEDDTNEVPDVKGLVQEFLTNLFISTFNHADEDERCYSDSFLDMPALPATETAPEETSEGTESTTSRPVKKRIPSFETIKRNLDKNRYRRLDRFQEDMFEVFEHARKVSRTDSQLYEDAAELQMFFIKKRDELCRNGEAFLSPALSYLDVHLQQALTKERKEKLPLEQKEDEEKKQMEAEEKKDKGSAQESVADGEPEDCFKYNDVEYRIGDFVYVENSRDKDLDPNIVCIEKIWKTESGEMNFSGSWFYRPQETFHHVNRKFLQNEVFKSDFNENVPFSKIMGKCFVMNVKDYFKMKPEGFEEKDIYNCESRYSTRLRSIKKIKVWSLPRSDIKIVPRAVPIVPVRVASVFVQKKEEDEEMDTDTDILDIAKENVPVNIENTENLQYYEQYNVPAGWFKLGDHVYVRSQDDKPYIARIDKLWTDNSENAFFHGPWYVHPCDTEHTPTRLFYRKEVLRSSIEDTNPMLSIQGHCNVMTTKEYMTSRHTEIPEHDTYICESKYIETEKAIKKIPKATCVKRSNLSHKVCDDEVYFFKKPIVINKEPSPLLLKAANEPYFEPEDIAVAPATPVSVTNTADTSTADGDNLSEKNIVIKRKGGEVVTIQKRKPREKSGKPWQPSGYLVFSAECRKSVQEENPEMSFGEISKLVGLKWRELEKTRKTRYEEKAKKIAEEQAAKQEAAEKAFNESLANFPPQSPADPRSMSPAASARPNTPGTYPQTPQGFQQHPGPAYASTPIQAAGAAGMPPSYSQSYPGAGPYPPAGMYPPPGGHYGPGTGRPMGPVPHPGAMPPMGYAPGPYPGPAVPGPYPPARMDPALTAFWRSQSGVPQRPPSPMFVSVPPRTQRLVHSEAYLRYIEGLSRDNDYISNWDKSLTATQENTPLDKSGRLPVNWLPQGPSHHGDTVSALWALRDLMLKDTLTISRTLEFNQLW